MDIFDTAVQKCSFLDITVEKGFCVGKLLREYSTLNDETGSHRLQRKKWEVFMLINVRLSQYFQNLVSCKVEF